MERDPLRADHPLAKVCGNTSEADLRAAAEAGADLVGFVSYPASPRHVEDDALLELGRAAADLGVPAIVVTVDRPRHELEDVVARGAFAGVQLCGAENPADWTGFPDLVLRRLGVAPGGARAAIAEAARWRGAASLFVLDRAETAGGTGLPVDLRAAWTVASEVPALLAGGLDAERVAALDPAAAAAFRGFDASSRLGLSPCTKDPERVAAFVRAAHSQPPIER